MKEIISTKTENAADTPYLLRARGSSSVQAVGRGRALDGGDSVQRRRRKRARRGRCTLRWQTCLDAKEACVSLDSGTDEACIEGQPNAPTPPVVSSRLSRQAGRVG